MLVILSICTLILTLYTLTPCTSYIVAICTLYTVHWGYKILTFTSPHRHYKVIFNTENDSSNDDSSKGGLNFRIIKKKLGKSTSRISQGNRLKTEMFACNPIDHRK